MVPIPFDIPQKITYTKDMKVLTHNPYKEIRESLNLSQLTLANDARVGEQVVRRTEQGLYAYPTKKISQRLSDLSGKPVAELEDEYAKWQKSVRAANSEIVAKGLITWFELYHHTIDNLVRAVAGAVEGETPSRLGFCKLLCINPSQLDRVLDYNELPVFLVNALTDAGIDLTVIGRINQTLAFRR